MKVDVDVDVVLMYTWIGDTWGKALDVVDGGRDDVVRVFRECLMW